MAKEKAKMDLLQGTLDLLILRVLMSRSYHGYDIAKRLQVLSEDLFQVGQGSLYPALHRMEKRGFICSEWGITDTGRKAKFYAITKEGQEKIETERSYWRQFSAAVEFILSNA